MGYSPRAELITGANLTGTSGTANRTYTLVNSNAITAQMSIMRASAPLQYGTDFTFDTATNTVTFISEVWDEQSITLDYFTNDSTPVYSTYYTSTLQIIRAAGIGVEVYSENLGTGNGSSTSYDLDFGNVITDSYTIQVATSGSNILTTLIETIDYSIRKDQGLITLTAAGVTKANTKVIYANYVYCPKMSDTILTTFIAAASKQVEKATNNYWGASTSAIEYFDGYDSGYPQTDEPFGTQIEQLQEVQLKYRGIISITSILFLDRTGATDKTLSTDDYRIVIDDEKNESRIIFNTTIPNGKMNVKVTYLHGYSAVPDLVQKLAALIGGLMAMVNISGGSYKDVTSYTIGRKTISIGEVYVNVREVINQLNARIEKVTEDLGSRYACA
jgi:hypothetical protein